MENNLSKFNAMLKNLMTEYLDSIGKCSPEELRQKIRIIDSLLNTIILIEKTN